MALLMLHEWFLIMALHIRRMGELGDGASRFGIGSDCIVCVEQKSLYHSRVRRNRHASISNPLPLENVTRCGVTSCVWDEAVLGESLGLNSAMMFHMWHCIGNLLIEQSIEPYSSLHSKYTLTA